MRISFTGDILCYKSQIETCRKRNGDYDFSSIVEQVKPIFTDSDYVVGSLETVIAGADTGYTKTDTCFNTPDSFLDAIKEMGVSMVTTANNHCFDRGEAGLLRTISKLDEFGLDHTGTRMSTEECPYLVKSFNGTKVSFLSYTYGTNSASNGYIIQPGKEYLVNLTRPQDPLFVRPLYKRIALALLPKKYKNSRKNRIVEDCVSAAEINNGRNTEYEASMVRAITDAKKISDIVVFCLHSGGQFNSVIGQYTMHLLNVISAAGADVIIANHAHTTLPIFKMNDCIVASGLGNFSFVPKEGYYVDGQYADYSVVLHLEIDNNHINSVSFDICKVCVQNSGLGITIPLRTLRNSDISKYDQFDEKRVLSRLLGKDFSEAINDHYVFPL